MAERFYRSRGLLRLNAETKIMKSFILLIFLALITLTGCAPIDTGKYSVSVGSLTADIASAQGNIAAAKPHSDSIGQSFLASASANLVSATKEVVTLKTAVDNLNRMTTELAKEKAQFFSDRQRADFWWIVGSSLGVIVLAIGLFVLKESTGGVVGTLAATTFHAVTLGTVWAATKLKTLVTKDTSGFYVK